MVAVVVVVIVEVVEVDVLCLTSRCSRQCVMSSSTIWGMSAKLHNATEQGSIGRSSSRSSSSNDGNSQLLLSCCTLSKPHERCSKSKRGPGRNLVLLNSTRSMF